MTPAREPTYSTKELAHICSITLRQVQWWCEAGLLHPQIVLHWRRFSREDVLRAHLIRRMRSKGLVSAAISPLLNRCMEPAAGYLVCNANGKQAHICLNQQEAIQRASKFKGPVIVIDIQGVQ